MVLIDRQSSNTNMFRGAITRRRGFGFGQLRSESAESPGEESRATEEALRRLRVISSEGELTNCNENPHVCGKEAACRSLDRHTAKCVCPHDLSPPTRDLKCPNRLLAPVTPRPIHNIILPNGNTTNGTTSLPEAEQIEGITSDGTSEVVGIAMAGVTLLGLLSVLVYLARLKCAGKKCQRSGASMSPRNLKKSLLLANKYTPNLQYFGSAPPEVPILSRDSIIFLRDIGEGCFGKVFKGEIRKNDVFETVAVKVLKDSASREAEEDFMREVEIMSTFRHENILCLLGVVTRDSCNGPWMIFEYMEYGDLVGVLRGNAKASTLAFSDGKQPLSKANLDWITLQIATGMTYLSSQRFVHRDLACRNCLVGSDLVVKIADFGMSRDVYTCDYYKISGSRLLPIRWMSPESVMYGRFTLESDVWSFGVVLWEIYSYGKQPYYGRTNEEVVKLILEGEKLIPPEECPALIARMMRDCWRAEPRERCRFSEILERLEKSSEKGEDGTLPRPPQGPVTVRSRDILDTDGYLLSVPALPTEYLQTLAD